MNENDVRQYTPNSFLKIMTLQDCKKIRNNFENDSKFRISRHKSIN